MRLRFALAAVLLAACGTSHRDDTPARTKPVAPPAVVEKAAPPPPEFPTTTRSLRLNKTVAVRLEPGEDAKRIGTIAVDTRIGWNKTEKAPGCGRTWVQIQPYGWVCGDALDPSDERPRGREIPDLDRDEIVPGVYGKITEAGALTFSLDEPGARPPKKKKDPRPGKPGKDAKKPAEPPPPPSGDGPVAHPDDPDAAAAAPVVVCDPKGPKMVPGAPIVGSANVRQYGVVTVCGKDYWKILKSDNEYVLATSVRMHVPSRYQGARLGDDTGAGLPLAFVWPRATGVMKQWTYSNAKGAGGVRQLDQRTLVSILETANDAAGRPSRYRIGAAEWIDASNVRLVAPVTPPALLLPGERWIDVDLDTQTLVAYEGELPVYATMVSTGVAGGDKPTPTEAGVYRMWKKVSETDMTGLSGEDPYSVATVPWTEFFSPEKGLALHTAYWHDQFGKTRSHGCVNLAPKDARWLYFWSDPQVPPGWTMAAGVVESPGSIVRVHSKKDPNPPERGYAQKVLEARQATAPR